MEANINRGITMTTNTFYTKKKEPLNLSLYKCPHDKKHTIREATDKTYCDIWCNHCGTGWKLDELQKVIQNKTNTLLVPIPNYDYYLGVYITITQSVNDELKKLKALMANMHYKYSLNVPWESLQSRTCAVVLTELDFEDDNKSEFRDTIYDRLFDNREILKPETFSKKLVVNRGNTELFDKLDNPKIIVSQEGIRFECDGECLSTPVVAWNKLIID